MSVAQSAGRFFVAPATIRISYGALTLSAVLFPRAAPVCFAIAGALALVGNVVRGDLVRDWFPTPPPLVFAYLFAGWALIASSWSPNLVEGAGKSVLMMAAIAIFSLTYGSAQRAATRQVEWAVQGAVGAVLVCAAYIAFEVLTHQWFARTLAELDPSLTEGMARHYRIENGSITAVSATNINRQTACLTLLFWPALFGIRYAFAERARPYLAALLIGCASIMVMFGDHQSSKAGLLVSVLVAPFAFFAPQIALRGAAIAWCTLILLIVPGAILLKATGVHDSDWLHFAAKGRIPIWSFTSEQVLKRPLAGHGTDATVALYERQKDEKGSRYRLHWADRAFARHPHNGYLQTWMELGLVGALLLLGFGWSLLRGLQGTSRDILILVLCTFVLAAVMRASSYSIWQAWILVQLVFAAVLTMFVRKLVSQSESGHRLGAKTAPEHPAGIAA